MIRAVLRFVTALMLAVVAFPPLAADATQRSTTHASVEALLSTRAKAVMDKDATAFDATVDPRASDTFRAEQRHLFEGLTSLPLQSFELRLRRNDGIDAADALDLASKRKADKAALPETQQLISLRDFDSRPSIDSLWSTYVERDGRWFVASNADGEPLGLRSARNLWDTGAVKATPTAHFLFLDRTTDAARLKQLESVGEEALSTFETRWTDAWNERLPVVIPGSQQEAATILETDADVADFVAFVSYRTTRDDRGWTAGAPRLYAQEENLADKSTTSQTSTVVHELTHAAGSAYTGPFTPAWLHEGLAEYVRYDRRPDLRPSAGNDRLTLPQSADFDGTGEALRNAYVDAASFVSYLSARFGPDAPERLFVAVGDRRVSAGTPSWNLDQAAREVTGVALVDLVRDWNVRNGRSQG